MPGSVRGAAGNRRPYRDMRHDADRDRRLPLVTSGRGLLSLKWSVIGAVVVLWNVLMLIAIKLNGGWGEYEDPRAKVVLGLATSALCLFSLLTVGSPRFRELVISPARSETYDPAPFVLVAVVSGVLAGAAIYSVFRTFA
jgi:hypothetical protein